jgi:Tfp pilus assembly protein PilV
MKNTTIVLLGIAVGILGLLAYLQAAALRNERQQAQQLAAKLDSMSKISTLDLQEKCANQAREEFKDYWEYREMSDHTDHYNPKLNKCFLLVRYSDTKTLPGSWFTYRMLEDAFEGKVYAEYSDEYDERTEKHTVSLCKVTVPSGEETICHSSDEFDALVNQYM